MIDLTVVFVKMGRRRRKISTEIRESLYWELVNKVVLKFRSDRCFPCLDKREKKSLGEKRFKGNDDEIDEEIVKGSELQKEDRKVVKTGRIGNWNVYRRFAAHAI